MLFDWMRFVSSVVEWDVSIRTQMPCVCQVDDLEGVVRGIGLGCNLWISLETRMGGEMNLTRWWPW